MTATKVSYDLVKGDISKIRNYAKVMQNIFGDFESTMKAITNPDAFEGDAATALVKEFNELKPKFTEYVILIEKFAKMFEAAIIATEQTDTAIADEAGNLNMPA